MPVYEANPSENTVYIVTSRFDLEIYTMFFADGPEHARLQARRCLRKLPPKELLDWRCPAKMSNIIHLLADEDAIIGIDKMPPEIARVLLKPCRSHLHLPDIREALEQFKKKA